MSYYYFRKSHNQKHKIMTDTVFGTYLAWAFYIALFAAAGVVGIKLQKIYNERGK